MVYIDRDGRVLERRPWSVERVLGIFMGIWFVILTFFKTLMSPFMSNDNQSGSSSTRRGGWGSDGGGGGGGSGYGPGGGGGGGGPNRRIGRISNTTECNMPGGCCG